MAKSRLHAGRAFKRKNNRNGDPLVKNRKGTVNQRRKHRKLQKEMLIADYKKRLEEKAKGDDAMDGGDNKGEVIHITDPRYESKITETSKDFQKKRNVKKLKRKLKLKAGKAKRYLKKDDDKMEICAKKNVVSEKKAPVKSVQKVVDNRMEKNFQKKISKKLECKRSKKLGRKGARKQKKVYLDDIDMKMDAWIDIVWSVSIF